MTRKMREDGWVDLKLSAKRGILHECSGATIYDKTGTTTHVSKGWLFTPVFVNGQFYEGVVTIFEEVK